MSSGVKINKKSLSEYKDLALAKLAKSSSDHHKDLASEKENHKKFHCDKCVYTCETAYVLEKHKIKVHKKVASRVKNTISIVKKSAISELKENHKKFQCDKCIYTCEAADLLENHKNKVHKKMAPISIVKKEIKDIACDECKALSYITNAQVLCDKCG